MSAKPTTMAGAASEQLTQQAIVNSPPAAINRQQHGTRCNSENQDRKNSIQSVVQKLSQHSHQDGSAAVNGQGRQERKQTQQGGDRKPERRFQAK